ncbi:uncharacterized protein [Littorina saxatilis]|uniref:WSC domain-containing protein n=1 Tax=Littorina saxatilis TaxID=31220 RepID=A0AAN9BP25_9CAEN
MEISVAVLWTLFLAESALAGYHGLVTPGRVKWPDARQACEDSGPSCDLSTVTVDQTDFWSSLSLTAGAHYWVGARKKDVLLWTDSKTPLIESVGCYEAPETFPVSSRSAKYNGPERCLSQCDGSVVALQDAACYCVTPEKMTSLTERPLEECHISCNNDPYRCGGADNRVSLYRTLDQTLLQIVGRKKAFYWRKSSNNENEFIVFTNKPRSRKGVFCVSGTGQYSTVNQGQGCPSGSEPLSFNDVKVMDFLEATSSMAGMEDTDYKLPLAYSRQLLWINGEKVFKSGGSSGGCVAVTYDGQGYFLVKRKCTESLPSVCSCYTAAPTTTEPTTTTTTTSTTTTTTTELTSTTTETTTPITTTTLPTTTSPSPPPPTTATQPPPPPPTTTTTTQPSAPSSTTQTTTQPTATTELFTTTQTTSTTAISSTQSLAVKNFPTTDFVSSTAAAPHSTTRQADFTSTMTDVIPTSSTTEKARELEPEKNSTVLFPFHAVNGSDGRSPLLPAAAGPSLSSGDHAPAPAGLSMEMVVGVVVGTLALVIVVVIVVVVVHRRRKSSSSSLLKNRASKSTPNYPI